MGEGWLLTVRRGDLTIRKAMLHLGYVCEWGHSYIYMDMCFLQELVAIVDMCKHEFLECLRCGLCACVCPWVPVPMCV